MKPLKFVCVEIRSPRTDPNPEKSKTNNSGWRKGLFIVFEDYNGNRFDWMPCWDEINNITVQRQVIQDLNGELARLNNGSLLSLISLNQIAIKELAGELKNIYELLKKIRV